MYILFFCLIIGYSFCQSPVPTVISPGIPRPTGTGNIGSVGIPPPSGTGNIGSLGGINGGNLTNNVTPNPFTPLNPNGLNNIEQSGIERPCEIFDVQCIRRYFVKHSKCKEVRGSVPEPYYRAQTKVFLTNINVTLDLDDAVYKGLNGKIEEFYINRQTDKLVLAVRFENLYTASECTYFRFHRRAREPIVIMDYLRALYSSLIVTIIIPDINNLQLAKGVSYTYHNDAFPRLVIGPKPFKSTDPTVKRVEAVFFQMLPISVREAFLTEGAFVISTFIQNTICDFGLKVL